MLKPEQVTTEEYAAHCYDEMKTGAILAGGGSLGALALALSEESHGLDVVLGVASGAALVVSYNCVRKAIAYKRQYFKISGDQ